ncbi:MAG: Eco57I restriction-modification methylase domain-containing protein [Myxococcales bacterium]
MNLSAPDPDQRRRFGQYYTPTPLVHALFGLLSQALEADGSRVSEWVAVDPSCGAGAFLGSAELKAFRALWGLDLDAEALSQAALACPGAHLVQGDAYGEGLEALCRGVGGAGPLAVIGNPPYVANSELLKSGRYQQVRDALLPFARDVAKGTSVRDDYVLFFGVADRLIEAAGGQGSIAFVTSSTFVDNFLYAPLRRWLLSRYRLSALVELGPEMFEGLRVATALSVWVRDPAGQAGRPFGHLRLSGEREARLAQLGSPLALAPAHPSGPALLLNAPKDKDTRLLETMRAAGDPIGSLFPLSFPGLKTRFEELLVDADTGRLADRMREFFASPDPVAFAARHQIPARAMGKLEAAFAARPKTRFAKSAIRPFAQFAGPKHRFRVPKQAMAWAYVDPELIPRGDHRMHGEYDPHQQGPKLVFNAREIPLVSAVVDGPTCIHDWRHSRFAPLRAPLPLVERGLFKARKEDLDGPLMLNLTTRWAEVAVRFDDPSDLLFYVCACINSKLVQERFAPLVGASEEVPIPRLDGKSELKLARTVAAAARAVAAREELPDAAELAIRKLYGV